MTEQQVADGGGADRPTEATMQQFEFSGRAGEYFGIWLSNLLLTIITLGVYSTWAKVRRVKYFHNHTRIAGHSLAYHATGKQIFKGRLIVIAIIFLFSLLEQVATLLSVGSSLIFTFLIPWIINSAMRFSARMSSWRNICLNWHGKYWKTFFFFVLAPSAVFVVLLVVPLIVYFFAGGLSLESLTSRPGPWPGQYTIPLPDQISLPLALVSLLIGILAASLLIPYVHAHLYSYRAKCHALGTVSFDSKSLIGPFYSAFFIGALVPAFLLSAVFGAVIYSILTLAQFTGMDPAPAHVLIDQYLIDTTVSVFVLFFFLWFFIYVILCRNLFVRALSLGNFAEFDSTVSPQRLIWITSTNLLLVMISLGFLFPWAKVRRYRYLCENTFIRTREDMDQFVDTAKQKRSAVGEEFAELELGGIDLGL